MQTSPGAGTHYRHHYQDPTELLPLILILCQTVRLTCPQFKIRLCHSPMKSMQYSPFKTAFKALLITSAFILTTLWLIPHTLAAPSSFMRILWTHHAVSPSCLCPCWPLYLECFLSHSSPTLNYPYSQAVFPWLYLSPVLPGRSCISVPLHFPSCTLQLYV